MDHRKSVVAIVDDDPQLLESLEDLLDAAGHAVRSFPSAQLLLENDHLAEIDCLITDIGMPVIDGFELQRLAKAARPELSVILITGRHEIAHQQRAVAQGEYGLFQKAFNSQAMLAAIDKALDTRHKEDGDNEPSKGMNRPSGGARPTF